MIEPMKLVGLSGPKGSGKSSIAHMLSEYGFVIYSFAEPIKQMTDVILSYVGYSDDVISDMLYGSLKEEPIDRLDGVTPREIMQTLGTEWGREQISPDIWVNIARHKLKRILPFQNVAIDDVRFENEVDLIHELGGVVVQIDRPFCNYDHSHMSESGVSSDISIMNDSSIEDAVRQLTDYLVELEGNRAEMV